MKTDFSEINYLQDPTFQELHADYEQFLLSMTGPTVIDVTGTNTDKCRVINTLLQGDEPSGLIALHRWLTTRDKNILPEVNLRFIICSVEAASKSPLFSKRFIDGCTDMNRCFGRSAQSLNVNLKNNNVDPKHLGCYERANLIEQAIRDVNPEVVIDLHNASSASPSFSISSVITIETVSLAALFCKTLILSDLNLGSLMEQKFSCPFLTIECGGRFDEQAHEVAFAGITQVASFKDINDIHQEKSVDVIYRPLRLQTKININLSYSNHDEGFSGVTLKNNIEHFNFGGANQGEMIGWIDGNGIENLQLLDKNNKNLIDEYFYIRENQLVCKQNIRVFKATTAKEVALNDCLFYVVSKASANQN